MNVHFAMSKLSYVHTVKENDGRKQQDLLDDQRDQENYMNQISHNEDLETSRSNVPGKGRRLTC